jgi:hypothetical protein
MLNLTPIFLRVLLIGALFLAAEPWLVEIAWPWVYEFASAESTRVQPTVNFLA